MNLAELFLKILPVIVSLFFVEKEFKHGAPIFFSGNAMEFMILNSNEQFTIEIGLSEFRYKIPEMFRFFL